MRARATTAAVGLALALALGVAGCSGGSGSTDANRATTAGSTPVADTGFEGFPLAVPVHRPSARLVDQDGQPYDVAARTHGRVTLLYVGYTHCPDLCPLVMASVARAVDRLTPAQRAKVDVLFVTADPARDTPPVLARWRDRFTPAMTALTGPTTQLDRVYAAIGMAPPTRDAADPDSIEHAAELYAFGTDDLARIAYSADATPSAIAHDIGLLLAGRRPPPPDPQELAVTGGTGRIGLVRVVSAYLRLTGAGAVLSMEAANSDPEVTDSLTTVRLPGDGPTATLATAGGATVASIPLPDQQLVRIVATFATVPAGLRPGGTALVDVAFHRGGQLTMLVPVSR